MNDRVIDLSEQPAHLSVRNGLLVTRLVAQRSPSNVAAVRQNGNAAGSESGSCATERTAGGDTGATEKTAAPINRETSESETGLRSERTKDPNEHTVPLVDIAVLIASHPQITYSQSVLAGLAEAGGIFVACNQKHMPIAMLLPLESHSTQTERFASQSEISVPLKKRLWQEIIRAKLRAQGRLLQERTGQDWGLAMLASRVRSGDPKNVEAHGAKIYWKALFGDDEFRRDYQAEGVNACLNYGYAVLRAIVARGLCGAGLHPGLGLHHHNRYNPFCLADDLMEPLRPVVDRTVAKLRDTRGNDVPVDKESKKAILESLLARFTFENESRTLFDWVARSAASLAASVESGERELFIPQL